MQNLLALLYSKTKKKNEKNDNKQISAPSPKLLMTFVNKL